MQLPTYFQRALTTMRPENSTKGEVTCIDDVPHIQLNISLLLIQHFNSVIGEAGFARFGLRGVVDIRFDLQIKILPKLASQLRYPKGGVSAPDHTTASLNRNISILSPKWANDNGPYYPPQEAI